MENSIKITGVNLVHFVRCVYDLSVPVGMGFLHFQEGTLNQEDAESLINYSVLEGREPYRKFGNYVVDMDYVRGRGCKMVVRKDENGDLWIADDWYDHSASQLDELLKRIGVSRG